MVALRCVHAALWTFQHSLRSAVLKGPLSRELPHQHPWPPTQTSAEGKRVLGALDERSRMETSHPPLLATASRSRSDSHSRHRSAELIHGRRTPASEERPFQMKGYNALMVYYMILDSRRCIQNVKGRLFTVLNFLANKVTQESKHPAV